MSDLVEELAELKRQIEEQRRRLDHQSGVIAAMQVPPSSAVLSQSATRRDALKKLVIGTAGALAAGGAVALVVAAPAGATDGVDLVIGNETQTSQTETALIYNGAPAGSSIFTVTDSSAGVGATLSPNSTVAAWCSGLRNIALSGYSRTVRGVGIYGSSELGTGIMAVGGVQANLQLLPGGLPGPERTTSHNMGELACDSSGDVWFSIGGGNPGTWRKVSGPATAGALHVLPEPLRAYDSRSASRLAAGSVTTVSLATGRNGAGVLLVAVPAGATAALVNVTLTGTVGTFGFIKAYSAALASPPATSVMNWSSTDENIANEITVALNSSAQLKVAPGGGATHVIVDIVGYYR